MTRSGLALAIVALSAAPLVIWHLSPPAWTEHQPATCMPDACFCEGIQAGGVRQPANSWSNMGFVLVGAAILMRDRRRFAQAFAAAAVALGVTSAYYHASLTFFGQWLDVIGMYFFVAVAMAHAVYAAGWVSARPAMALGAGITLLSAGLSFFVPETRRYAFFILVLALLATEIVVTRRTRLPGVGRGLLLAGLSFGVAFAVWIADIRGWLCAPTSLVQGHAFWHLGSAAAVAALYGVHARLDGLRQGEPLRRAA